MEKYNANSYFMKLAGVLSVYHIYVRRLNAIAVSRKVPHRKRIHDINMLLIHFSDALLEAEKDFLDTTQFPVELNKYSAPVEEICAMGTTFTIYHN